MSAILAYVGLLVVVHAAWAFFYLTGTVLRTPLLSRGNAAEVQREGGALVDLALMTAAGMAITGFVTFLLGLVSLINVLGLLLWLAVLSVLFFRLGDPPWRSTFWRARLAWLRPSLSAGALVVYVAALAIGFGIARPDLGSDATFFHMVYATDWAQAHSLVVDPLLRNPYYASNWLLLQTWMALFNLPEAADGLTWLAGLLSLLAVYGFVYKRGRSADEATQRSATLIALAACAAIAISPVFLHWVDVAMIDVPIGFFLLSTALALSRVVESKQAADLAVLILCGAFFIGMKISLIAYYPLAAAGVLLAAVLVWHSWRRVVVAVAMLTVLASPWYVRNLTLDGDPIPPVLNIALHGTDPYWSRADVLRVEADLHSHEGGPEARVAIPRDVVFDTTDWQFREPGVTLLMLLLGLPAIVVSLPLLTGRRTDIALLSMAAIALYAIGYWISTSYLARYSLEFVALLAAVCAGVVATASRRYPAARWAAVALVVAIAFPSPGSGAFFRQLWNTNVDFYRNYTTREAWMLPRAPVYMQAEYVSGLLHRAHREDLRVYRVQTETDRLYWKQFRVNVLGDVVGPERYADFVSAVQSDSLSSYVNRFHIGGFVIPSPLPSFVSPPVMAQFEREVAALGFRRVLETDQRYVTYVSKAL